MFEKEALQFYKKLHEESRNNAGHWSHSLTENWKVDYFPGVLDETSLVNFRRMPFCDGMISFPDRPLKNKVDFLTKPWLKGIPWWQKARGARDIFVMAKRLRSRFGFSLADISDNLVGNPCYYRLGKSRVTDFAIRMCFYKKYIEREFPGAQDILEIGGGFGGICERLFSSDKMKVRNYAFVELPETLPLAYWYLKNSLGAKPFDLAAPWQLPHISGKYDLLINTMSFQHMSRENLNYYFSEIGRLNIPNLFLVEGTIRVRPGEVNFDDYPIPGKYKLAKEEKHPFSDHSIRIYKIG